MSEIITIQVGQCGNQIGGSFWPIVLEEYGIKNVPGGLAPRTAKDTNHPDFSDSFHSFLSTSDRFDFRNIRNYSDLKKYNVKAKAVLVDMEDGVLNRYHNGPLRNLFDKSCTVKNYPGSGNNWGVGYFEHGSTYEGEIEDVVRRVAEKCSSLQGFNLVYSVGGGTGAGLGSRILEILAEHFPDIDRFATCVYPNGSADVVTCPYNMSLATKWLADFASCVFPVENRALQQIVRRQMGRSPTHEPTARVLNCRAYEDINTVVVNMLLHLTSGSRFSGTLNVDLNDVCSNLVPFPNTCFICSSFSPVTISADKSTEKGGRNLCSDIFAECCSKRNQLLMLDPLGYNSVLLGACALGRGDCSMGDVRRCVEQLRARARFCAWGPAAVKVGLCSRAPVGHPASLLALFNTSAVASLLADVLQHFNTLYRRKAHVHHYTKVSGFEIDLFEESRDTLWTNIHNYKSLTRTENYLKPRLTYL